MDQQVVYNYKQSASHKGFPKEGCARVDSKDVLSNLNGLNS